MYGIIYKATNTVNQKVYIGLTTKTLEKRKKEHQLASKGKKECFFYFQHALSKYGFDSFQWEVIDTAESKYELIEKEKLWITYFGSYGENGYNLTPGGELNEGRKKEVYDFDFDGNLIAIYESAQDAGKIYGCGSGIIGMVAKGKYIHKKKHVLLFSDEWISLKSMQEEVKKRKTLFLNLQPYYAPKAVIGINKKLEIIEFTSISNASDKTGVERKNIRLILNGKNRNHSEWRFFKKEDFPKSPEQKKALLEKVKKQFLNTKRSNYKESKVFQYSLKGIFIKEYDSVFHAKEELGFKYPQQLIRCSNGYAYQALGSIWLLENDYPSEEKRKDEIKERLQTREKTQSKSVTVVALYPNGDTEIFESKTKCSKAFNTSLQTVMRKLIDGKSLENGIRLYTEESFSEIKGQIKSFD